MKDTSKKVEKVYGEMLQGVSGAKRFKMGFSMFEFGKKILLAGIGAEKGNLRDRRRGVFLKVYGNDFGKEKLAEILEHL